MSDNIRPLFKFYPRDFLTDEKVQMFDLETVGAYIKILCVMWKSNDGMLPNDNKSLHNLLGVTHKKFSRIWKNLQPGIDKRNIFSIHFDSDGNEWIHSKRLDDERLQMIELSNIRSDIGKKGGRPKKLLVNQLVSEKKPKRKQAGKQTKSDTDTDTDKRINNTSFDYFYEAYPLKKGKAQAIKAWIKLKHSSELLTTILEAIENQKAEKEFLTQQNKFCPEWKHPATWINGECWEDEIQASQHQPGPPKEFVPPI